MHIQNITFLGDMKLRDAVALDTQTCIQTESSGLLVYQASVSPGEIALSKD